jgi:HD-GYP domain-containing protein (c-di-GMP phosphodiesterase class II)
MSYMPGPEQQGQLAESMLLPHAMLSRREWLAETIIGGGFVAATCALIAIRPPHAFHPWPALLCVVLLAIATRVEFDLPWGFTVATQLAFVPLLFALPVTLVPVAVVVALLLAALPEMARHELHPSRLVKRIGNAWFAIGPVAVFVAAGTTPRHAGAWLLLAALAAEFAVDFVSSTLRFRISHSRPWRDQLQDGWVYMIDAALSGVGLAIAEEIHRAPYAPLALLPLLGLLAVFARERKIRLEQLIELNHAYRGTALVLGDVIKADDGYTGEHSRGVVRLCLDVADQLALNPECRRNLEFGALLHDVGKIAIPKEIINKPGKLSEREWLIIKTHTIEGQKLLDTVGGFMHDVGLIVRSHHERWDGDGYPDGLAGEEIPLESRIIACCDTWNAMQTDRSYRTRLAFDQAATEMRAVAGSQLDPTLVKAVLAVVEHERPQNGRGPANWRALLTTKSA